MTKTANRRPKNSKKAQSDLHRNSKNEVAKKTVPTSDKHAGKSQTRIVIVIVVLGLAIAAVAVYCGSFFQDNVIVRTVGNTGKGDKLDTARKEYEKQHQSYDRSREETNKGTQGLPKEFKDFKLSVQKTLRMNSIREGTKELKVQEIKHSNRKSQVHAYVIKNFLSDHECDGLVMVHSRHTSELNKIGPIICFDSIESFREYLKDAKIKRKVTLNDFTEGTTCVNGTFSAELQPHFKWSFSTAFYPGESEFSFRFAEKIRKATGLELQNGGKFQITSYPQNVGYKNHTDCVVSSSEKRDRFATVLVYLRDVEDGGETQFPQLGISVKPRKGLALVWNSMNQQGECDPSSIHNAAKVVKGHKYILQRWYYYHNFPALGKRPQQPYLPHRQLNQPRVTCDEYEHGSCRWYDEWNYDHIIEYNANLQNLI